MFGRGILPFRSGNLPLSRKLQAASLQLFPNLHALRFLAFQGAESGAKLLDLAFGRGDRVCKGLLTLIQPGMLVGHGVDRLLQTSHCLRVAGQSGLSGFDQLQGCSLDLPAVVEVSSGSRVAGLGPRHLRRCLLECNLGSFQHRLTGAIGIGDLDTGDRDEVALRCDGP